MRSVTYTVMALLVVAHCLVSQYFMFTFIEEVRQQGVVPMYSTVQNLASNNTCLNSRIECARRTVATVSDENTRLRASLNESVEMLKDEIDENNRLNQQIENLEWRVSSLQDTLKQLTKGKYNELEPVEP